MPFIKFSRYLLALLVLCVSFGAQADHGFKKDLDAGKAVVFIINAKENATSEQYADWSHYLNEFAKEVGKSYVFHKVSSKKLDKFIYDAAKYQKAYSLLFIKKGKPSYFYNGAIVEPQVYQFMKLAYEGKPIQPDYLTQFAPREVKIKFKACK